MNVRPNQTQVTGKIRSIRPSDDGIGGEVDLEIHSNDTPNPDDDFLQPPVGETLTVFTSDPAKLHVGHTVQATLGLSGGPFNQRAILRSAVDQEPTSIQPAPPVKPKRPKS